MEDISLGGQWEITEMSLRCFLYLRVQRPGVDLSNRPKGLISMSTKLGSKAVEFGKAEVKKKSKKTTKNKKKKSRAADQTNYDSMI